MISPRRYEVWLIELDPTQGSEIQKTRPCLVVSPNEMNECSASTTFPGQRQLFFPTGDNYPLSIRVPSFYTGADRGRG